MSNPIGLRDYVLKSPDENYLFHQSASLGFQGIEIVPSQKDFLEPGESKLVQLRQAQELTGLSIPCLSLSAHHGLGLSCRDSSAREQALIEIRICFKWAHILGAQIILFPFFGVASLLDEETRKRVVPRLKELCLEAQIKGLQIAYEGDLPASIVRSMALEINSDAFACYFDLANPILYGLNPVKELETLGSLVASVHVKDFKVTLGDCRPGQGCVPLALCAQALRKLEYKGWLILETPPASTEVVSSDLSYVREVFLK